MGGDGKGKIFLVSWDGQAFLPLLNILFLFGIPIIAHLICPLYPSYFLFMFMFYFLFFIYFIFTLPYPPNSVPLFP